MSVKVGKACVSSAPSHGSATLPLQLVEARHDESGRLVPWRSRKELGEQIPSVLKRFPSNDAYAAATLEECRRLLVARVGSGWFIYTGYAWFRQLPAGVPGAYRLFWCYGPESGQITIIAITPHP